MMLLEHLHLTSLYCCWEMWSKGFTVAASTCVTTTAACVGVKHCIRVVSVRHVRRHELDCGRQLEHVGCNIAVIQSQDNCWGNMYNSLWDMHAGDGVTSCSLSRRNRRSETYLLCNAPLK